MIVTYQDMPARIRGVTVRSIDNGEECYTIILNACLSAEEQKKAYLHEMFHIENDDFSKADINEIERTAHEHRSII